MHRLFPIIALLLLLCACGSSTTTQQCDSDDFEAGCKYMLRAVKMVQADEAMQEQFDRDWDYINLAERLWREDLKAELRAKYGKGVVDGS
jgi:thiamine biosynthesis lipoprotein ApbE